MALILSGSFVKIIVDLHKVLMEYTEIPLIFEAA